MMPSHTPSHVYSRRGFLRSSVALGGGAAFVPLLARLSAAETSRASSAGPDYVLPAGPARHWYQEPLRVLQTVLREPDAKDYKVDATIEYIKKLGANTLIINGGGVVDFFQNPLPAANPNPFIGNRDLLGEIAAACKDAGFRVVARVDFRGVEERVYREHPDWFTVDVAGKPIQLVGQNPKLYTSCYTGYYRNEHAEEFIRYLMSHYPLDGIWHNSIAFYDVCHCPRCKQSYREDSGLDVPDPAKAKPEELARFMIWKAKVADLHVKRTRAVVKSFGEDKSYAAEVFGGMFEAGGRIGPGIDLYNARDHFDFIVATGFLSENNPVVRYEELYHSATLVRLLKSMAPEKETVILYGDNGTSHRYIVDPLVDSQIWLWEALSVGGHFWNCSFIGRNPADTYDRRGAYNSVEPYHFLRDHEAVLAGQTPVANVGLYYSKSTREFYHQAPPEGDRFAACFQGMERVFVQNHIPYDLVVDDQLTSERLQRYRLIVLPNVRCLSQAQMDALANFVRGGGRLIATYATSLYDENGTQRKDFGLADVFGCHFTGQRVDSRKDTYQYILQPEHPIVAPDSNQTELLLTSGYTLLCRADSDAQVICTHVPTINNQPPEKAWLPKWPNEFPTAVEHSYGKGKVLYFPNQPDQLSYDFGHPDGMQILARGIKYLVGDDLPLETTAPESVHVNLTRSLRDPRSYILSFINTTSAPTRPIQRIFPVSDLEVTLRLDKGVTFSHQVLRAQGDCTVEANDSRVRVRLSRLEDFAAVHLYPSATG